MTMIESILKCPVHGYSPAQDFFLQLTTDCWKGRSGLSFPLEIMFRIIFGLVLVIYIADNFIFAILFSLQTDIIYSGRSDIAYNCPGNVFSFLTMMVWARAVGLNSKIELLEVTSCCWQLLLQEFYFINLFFFFGAATINLKWFVRRKLKLLKSLIILSSVTSMEELRQKMIINLWNCL